MYEQFGRVLWEMDRYFRQRILPAVDDTLGASARMRALRFRAALRACAFHHIRTLEFVFLFANENLIIFSDQEIDAKSRGILRT